MSDRKLWYSELASTILLWVEEVPNHLKDAPDSWKGTVQRRPMGPLIKDGPPIEVKPQVFSASTAEAAMRSAEITVRNAPFYSEYAHRLGELNWKQWTGSDEEWEAWKARFIISGRTE